MASFNPGDTINLRDGTYNTPAAMLTITKGGITVKAYQGETPIFDSNRNNTGTQNTDVTDVLRITGTGTQSVPTVLDGITVTDAGWHGISIVNANWVIVRNCTVYDTWQGGIRVFGSDNCTVTQNVVYATGECASPAIGGVGTIGAIGVTNYSDDVTISRNIIHDTYWYGIDCAGFGKRIVAEYNVIYNMPGNAAIYTSSADLTARYNCIYNGSGNTTSYGISHRSEKRYDPNGNKSIQTPGSLIAYGNLIASCRNGIHIHARDSTITGDLIYNNTIVYPLYRGILLEKGDNVGPEIYTDASLTATLKNNIITKEGSSGTLASTSTCCNNTGSINDTWDYNLWSSDPGSDFRGANDPGYDTYAAQTIALTGGVTWSNLSVGTVTGNEFSLGATSDAINAGTPISGYNERIESASYAASPPTADTVIDDATPAIGAWAYNLPPPPPSGVTWAGVDSLYDFESDLTTDDGVVAKNWTNNDVLQAEVTNWNQRAGDIYVAHFQGGDDYLYMTNANLDADHILNNANSANDEENSFGGRFYLTDYPTAQGGYLAMIVGSCDITNSERSLYMYVTMGGDIALGFSTNGSTPYAMNGTYHASDTIFFPGGLEKDGTPGSYLSQIEKDKWYSWMIYVDRTTAGAGETIIKWYLSDGTNYWRWYDSAQATHYATVSDKSPADAEIYVSNTLIWSVGAVEDDGSYIYDYKGYMDEVWYHAGCEITYDFFKKYTAGNAVFSTHGCTEDCTLVNSGSDFSGWDAWYLFEDDGTDQNNLANPPGTPALNIDNLSNTDGTDPVFSCGVTSNDDEDRAYSDAWDTLDADDDVVVYVIYKPNVNQADNTERGIAGQWDVTGSEKVWMISQLDHTGDGDTQDDFCFNLGHDNGADEDGDGWSRLCTEDHDVIGNGTQTFHILAVYDNSADDAFLWVWLSTDTDNVSDTGTHYYNSNDDGGSATDFIHPGASGNTFNISASERLDLFDWQAGGTGNVGTVIELAYDTEQDATSFDTEAEAEIIPKGNYPSSGVIAFGLITGGTTFTTSSEAALTATFYPAAQFYTQPIVHGTFNMPRLRLNLGPGSTEYYDAPINRVVQLADTYWYIEWMVVDDGSGWRTDDLVSNSTSAIILSNASGSSTVKDAAGNDFDLTLPTVQVSSGTLPVYFPADFQIGTGGDYESYAAMAAAISPQYANTLVPGDGLEFITGSETSFNTPIAGTSGNEFTLSGTLSNVTIDEQYWILEGLRIQ